MLLRSKAGFLKIVVVSGGDSGASCPTHRRVNLGAYPLIAAEPWSRTRDVETFAVQRLPVQGCESPSLRSGVLYAAVVISHPSRYPLCPGSCFRTPGGNVGTELGVYSKPGFMPAFRPSLSVPDKCVQHLSGDPISQICYSKASL